MCSSRRVNGIRDYDLEDIENEKFCAIVEKFEPFMKGFGANFGTRTWELCLKFIGTASEVNELALVLPSLLGNAKRRSVELKMFSKLQCISSFSTVAKPTKYRVPSG